MRKWLPAALIAITYVLSLVMLPRLPAVVTLDLGPLLPFEVEGDSAPRAFLAFGLPTVALALWLFFLWASSRAGLATLSGMFRGWAPTAALEPHAIARFRPTYDVVVACVIGFVLAFHLSLAGLAAGGPPSIARGFLLLIGLGLAAMGNVMPRLRPNPVMGLRTRATLNDPVLWARLHRVYWPSIFTLTFCTVESTSSSAKSGWPSFFLIVMSLPPASMVYRSGLSFAASASRTSFTTLPSSRPGVTFTVMSVGSPWRGVTRNTMSPAFTG